MSYTTLSDGTIQVLNQVVDLPGSDDPLIGAEPSTARKVEQCLEAHEAYRDYHTR